MSAETLLYFIPFWVILAFSVIIHECAHGFAAYKLGDPTAYLAGRITLNPIRHIDLIWTILMPLVTYFASSGSFIFGGAKPVPINPYNFRNSAKGMMISSIAGPLSNFALAIMGFIGFLLAVKILPLSGFFLAFNEFIFRYVIIINVMLGIFNLIPVPPLDGSRVLRYFLPWDMKVTFDQIERSGIGMMILMVLVVFGGTGFIHGILLGIDKLLELLAR